MFGFTRDEAIGRSNYELGLISLEELQRVRDIIKMQGTLHNEEMTCRNREGYPVFCLVTTMPVVLNGKDLVLTSFNDITRLKKQNNIIVEQHKDLSDSVNYALRIQEALLPPKAFIEKLLPESFILHKPKAIVSGDFYWMEKSGDKLYVAAADCTGHGVPGALMSIIGYNLISKSMLDNGDTKPCEILNDLSRGIYKMLRQHSKSEGVNDGLDISVISIDRVSNTLEFAGARQPVFHVRGNELLKLVPDRFPIGIHAGRYLQEFNNQQIRIQKGDMIYLYTDGYTDQFGGPERKKFKSIQFQKLLLSIQHLTMAEQKKTLDHTIEEWKGDYEQIDDIMIIGIRI